MCPSVDAALQVIVPTEKCRCIEFWEDKTISTEIFIVRKRPDWHGMLTVQLRPKHTYFPAKVKNSKECIPIEGRIFLLFSFNEDTKNRWIRVFTSDLFPPSSTLVTQIPVRSEPGCFGAKLPGLTRAMANSGHVSGDFSPQWAVPCPTLPRALKPGKLLKCRDSFRPLAAFCLG